MTNPVAQPPAAERHRADKTETPEYGLHCLSNWRPREVTPVVQDFWFFKVTVHPIHRLLKRNPRCLRQFTGDDSTRETISRHCSGSGIHGLTAAFSRSQPTDSQYRWTSSRFCCKALFWLPSFAFKHASPFRCGHELLKTTLSALLSSSATGRTCPHLAWRCGASGSKHHSGRPVLGPRWSWKHTVLHTHHFAIGTEAG
jgi:hypothetical protein